MNNITEISNVVKNYIFDNFIFGLDENNINDDDSFMELGLLDSTGTMELITFIEEEFDVKVSDDEIIPENIDSISSICRFVQAKIINKQE